MIRNLYNPFTLSVLYVELIHSTWSFCSPYVSLFSDPGLNLQSHAGLLTLLSISKQSWGVSVLSSLSLLGMGFITWHLYCSYALISDLLPPHISSSVHLNGSYHIKLLEILLLFHFPRFSKASWFGTEGPSKTSAQPTFAIFSLLPHWDFDVLSYLRTL